jgi:ureidoacrylate peracid hydrolase
MSTLTATPTTGRTLSIEARSETLTIHTQQTAVLVVDMQNDFGAEGGMFHRAGIDISPIRAAIKPTAQVLDSARDEGIKIVYLKMGFRPDLSDAGLPGSPNRDRHIMLGVGERVQAPDGSDSRVLIRDQWGTKVIPELAPEPADLQIYKHRFSGFYQTELDTTLKQHGIRYLIVTGCTTSICVESTIRDAMFRDYSCILLADCCAEPIGHQLSRSNHEASLLVVEVLFGWVSSSDAFTRALSAGAAAR